MSKKSKSPKVKVETKVKEKSSPVNTAFLFDKRNYMFMAIGAACVALGFILMTGHDANTRPDGTFDPDYWNEGIFSWVRIRLSPFLVLLGFVIEGYAIMLKPKA